MRACRVFAHFKMEASKKFCDEAERVSRPRSRSNRSRSNRSRIRRWSRQEVGCFRLPANVS